MSSPSVPSVSCSICRDNFSEASETAALACGHLFHVRCIGEWLKQSQTCPQCRRQLRNPQKETTRVYLSFGSTGEDDQSADGEPPGLAELRQQLATVKEENEDVKKRLRHRERREALVRRDLKQRQRQISQFTTELETCKESIAQQETENNQLMQLLAVESDNAEIELRRLRSQLSEERLARDRLVERQWAIEGECEDLRSRLEASRQEVELLADALQSERDAVGNATEEVLAREAEIFQLTKRLTVGHAQNSLLADRLRRSQLRVAQLGEQLLRDQTLGSGSSYDHLQQQPFVSLPAALPKIQSAAAPVNQSASDDGAFKKAEVD